LSYRTCIILLNAFVCEYGTPGRTKLLVTDASSQLLRRVVEEATLLRYPTTRRSIGFDASVTKGFVQPGVPYARAVCNVMACRP
jgi:uracil-DNA glycosylase